LKFREFLARKIEARPRSSLLSRLWPAADDGASVTYSTTESNEIGSDEKRLEARRRTRLRVGKILDRGNRFLSDATIIDRSCGGWRLLLAREVAAPEIFHFFDEESETIFLARIVWRRQCLWGVRRGAPVAATPRQIASLRGKFYAVRE